MLVAKALAQALTEVFSGDAFDRAGANAAIVATASRILRIIMVVFLEGQKIPTPRRQDKVRSPRRQTRNICTSPNFSHVSRTESQRPPRQATRQLRKIHCVSSCRSSRA